MNATLQLQIYCCYILILFTKGIISVKFRTCNQRCAMQQVVICEDEDLQAIPVQCNHSRRLSLSYNNIRELTDSSLHGYTKLEELSVTFNSMARISSSTFHSCQSSLKWLYLSDNNLRMISSGTFANLTAVREIDLSYNDLLTVAKGAFQNLPALKKLTLEGNYLSSFMPDTFMNINVKHLNLKHNNLIGLDAEFLKGINTLEVLNLGFNRIEEIHRDALSTLSSLQKLSLRRNYLEHFDCNMLNNMTAIDVDLQHNQITLMSTCTDNVQHLNLRDNPVICDVTNFEIAEWFQTHGLLFPRCEQPLDKGDVDSSLSLEASTERQGSRSILATDPQDADSAQDTYTQGLNKIGDKYPQGHDNIGDIFPLPKGKVIDIKVTPKQSFNLIQSLAVTPDLSRTRESIPLSKEEIQYQRLNRFIDIGWVVGLVTLVTGTFLAVVCDTIKQRQKTKRIIAEISLARPKQMFV